MVVARSNNCSLVSFPVGDVIGDDSVDPGRRAFFANPGLSVSPCDDPGDTEKNGSSNDDDRLRKQ